MEKLGPAGPCFHRPFLTNRFFWLARRICDGSAVDRQREAVRLFGKLFLCSSVPEGRCDRSLARSAWDSVTPKEPSRRVRCDSRRCALAHDTISFHGRHFLVPEYSLRFQHISTRNPSGISYARSYRTLRDGSFGVALSQALRAGYDRCTGRACRHFATAPS